MATIVDLEDLQEDNREELEEGLEADREESANAEDNFDEATKDSSDDLPDKYKGKSAAELAEMHANLEKLLGRQSQEVSEMRQAFDRMVQQSIQSQQSAPEPEDDEEVDFWADPDKAINRAISKHPAVQEAAKISQQAAHQAALRQLNEAHPDAKEIVSDPEFKEWINASPVRTRLLYEADAQYNYDAANEVFSLWKERKSFVNKQNKIEKSARKQEVNKASTGSARSTSGEVQAKKILRRRDIIDLMKTDPKRYEAMQDEIAKAYIEGRVK